MSTFDFANLHVLLQFGVRNHNTARDLVWTACKLIFEQFIYKFIKKELRFVRSINKANILQKKTEIFVKKAEIFAKKYYFKINILQKNIPRIFECLCSSKAKGRVWNVLWASMLISCSVVIFCSVRDYFQNEITLYVLMVELSKRKKEIKKYLEFFYGVNKSYVSEVIWNWLIYVLIVLYRSESGWEKEKGTTKKEKKLKILSTKQTSYT